ncbi:MAG: NmrA family NAD(P)-binding protein [Nostoc sp.]|uniref:NmrA family NAD(P)-binding protein n=1 Tax=Nostoc sp. TaxID=1180 RepID=UPI002FF57CD7
MKPEAWKDVYQLSAIYKESEMYAITGITGQVGGAVARKLLSDNQSVCAVIRDTKKGTAWVEQGCTVALADMNDADALTAAFRKAEGVFVVIPPNFAPSPGFPETRAIVAALRTAIAAAHPGKVVCLSTIGAQATQPNLLTQLQILEQVLGDLPMPIAFLRPAWFMENAAWDVAPARESGIIQSFLQPLDKPVPMIATADIGRVASELLQQTWSGRQIVEIEGPQRVTPNDIAKGFSKILGRPVHAEVVPRETWEALFKAQGTADPEPRIRMLDGFNEGWMEFESGESGSIKGEVELETVLKSLVER